MKPDSTRPDRQGMGRIGEEAAAAHLQGRGCQILARNFRQRFAEIDIVARCGDTLVFVEVKTRSSLRFGAPAEAVTPAKQRRLSKIALAYMMQHNLAGCCARFDVIAVLLDSQGRPSRIEQIENAFEAQP